MKKFRQENPNTVVVDAGNLFVELKQYRPKQPITPEQRQRLGQRAEALARVYQQLDLKGIAVGASDLLLGVPALKDLGKRHRLPLLSANLRGADGQRLFPASAMVTVGGVKIGLFGLTGKHGRFRDLLDDPQVKLDALPAAIGEQVQALRAAGAQVVVLLGAASQQELTAAAAAMKGVDVVIASGTGRIVEALDKVGEALLVEAGNEGKYLGIVRLHVRGQQFTFEDLSERFSLAKQLLKLEDSRRVLQQRLDAADGAVEQPEALAQRLESLDQSLARVRGQLAAANQRQPAGSFVTGQLVPMALALPEDPATVQLLAAPKP